MRPVLLVSVDHGKYILAARCEDQGPTPPFLTFRIKHLKPRPCFTSRVNGLGDLGVDEVSVMVMRFARGRVS